MIGEQLINHLDSAGLGTKGTDLFLGYKPEAPNAVSVAYEETAPSIAESEAFNIDSVGIQIVTRADSYIEARDNINAIHKALAGYTGKTFTGGSNAIRSTRITTPPSSIGTDEKDRFEWTVHYAIEYETTNDFNNRQLK